MTAFPRLHRLPLRLVQTVAIAVLTLAVGLGPTVGWAQDGKILEEGRALHRPTKQLYYFRIESDSTVYIRNESAGADSALTIPAHTLSSIYVRSERNLSDSDSKAEYSAIGYEEYMVIGYEDNNLILRFTQRFNLFVLLALIVVLVLGGGLSLWLWRRLSKEQRRREALAQSRRYLAQGREKERERLAQEIHDGPVQDLHGLHMQLKALSGTENGDSLDTVGDELMRVTGELRAMSADLHPPALQRFGLAAALRSHADRLRDRHDDLRIDLDLADECDLDDRPDEFSLSVFRVAQEAMNNAVQHGEARHIQVQLRCPDPAVELEVRDDGSGFTPPDDWHALAEQDHYGLLGMRERAEAVDGQLDVESTPGDGTRVRLRGAAAPSATEAPPVATPA
jgi:signal transduction histidine kinase